MPATDGAISLIIDRPDLWASIEISPYRRRAGPGYPSGWHVSADVERADGRQSGIGYAYWRSRATALRAVERLLAGRRVRIPTGRRSGLWAPQPQP